MGNERGLPSIPRGLGRELTTYLQALHNMLLGLSGLSRGSDRALRMSDGSVSTGTVTASIGQASVLTRHLADKAVTSSKMADGCVTAAKLAQSAVTDKAIQAGAVTGTALATGAVSASKIKPGVLPVWVTGSARNGEIITLPGVWAATPLVAVTALSLHSIQEGEQVGNPVRVGVAALREVEDEEGKGTGQWEFDATGDFEWAAIGYGQ